VQAVSIYNS